MGKGIAENMAGVFSMAGCTVKNVLWPTAGALLRCELRRQVAHVTQ